MVVPLLIPIALSPLIARLLAMAVSREREYLADATAAQYTRNPRDRAGALEKIRDAGIPFHKANRGTAHCSSSIRYADGLMIDKASWRTCFPAIRPSSDALCCCTEWLEFLSSR